MATYMPAGQSPLDFGLLVNQPGRAAHVAMSERGVPGGASVVDVLGKSVTKIRGRGRFDSFGALKTFEGAVGTYGVLAYSEAPAGASTTLTSSYSMPGVGMPASASVADVSPFSVGQAVDITSLGVLQVASIGAGTLELTNLDFAGNAPTDSVAASGSIVTALGIPTVFTLLERDRVTPADVHLGSVEFWTMPPRPADWPTDRPWRPYQRVTVSATSTSSPSRMNDKSVEP